MPWYSVAMNVIPIGFFKGGYGLRQGDPLSPYLLILVEEIFTRMIKKWVELGKIVPFYHPRGTLIVSHLLYTDDIVPFSNGGKASLRSIMNVLKVYDEWSGQVVNKRKSSILFSKHITPAHRRMLLQVKGFMEGRKHLVELGFS